MDLLQLLTLLVIAGICGAIAQWIVAFSPGSLLVSIIVGVIGAYLGTALANLAHIPNLPFTALIIGTLPFNLLWALLGSIVLLYVLKLLRNSGRVRLFTQR
ncbi:MAG: GlsB/YeaQ/YmgE family stress response membrane protein [Chloroflexi bacterium SZAS-1]|nr:GlsB/YeaQ/YmgE family stress response membrane protein [Chloroflexi bacterium SZAS-1]HNP85158.1 GlsB/YeaQ/YmgE family stress response membrane protein [Kouleothrix sp.]